MFTIPAGERLIGLQLPIQSQSSLYAAEWERTAGLAELARIAADCDRLGFGYIAVCDHVALPESLVEAMSTHWMDPIGTLAWLAAQTERIMLMTHVYVLAYRHPLMAAKQLANLDHLSSGRLICGIGAGHVEAEFERLGVDFHHRGQTLDASIPQLQNALEHEFVDGFGATPRPAQTPRPPVWVAGSSPAAIRRAARLGDGWLPQGPSDARQVALLTEERARAGRADGPFAVGHITPFVRVGSGAQRAGTLSASPESVADQVLAGVVEGVNQLQVRFDASGIDDYCDQLAAFAADVLPVLTVV